MAGQIKVVDVIPSLSGSRTKDVSSGGAPIAWRRANFFLDVESITPGTGSVDVTLRVKLAGSVAAITAALNVTGTGITEFAITAQWTGTTDAIPEPSETVVTFNGDASEFSGRVYMMAA